MADRPGVDGPGSLIEATTKRLEKTSLLTAFFLLVIQRSAPGDTQSLLQAVYLCINRVRACVIHLCRSDPVLRS